MSDFIGIDITGIPEVTSMLSKIPDAAADAGTDAANEYMLNVMRAYVPYKYITFRSAYGGFFSEKQRRFVMANISEGNITPGRSNRSQRLRNGWRIEGKGKKGILVNEVPYSPYVQGSSKEQARMMRMIGWDNLEQVIRDRTGRIVEKFSAAVEKAIRKLTT